MDFDAHNEVPSGTSVGHDKGKAAVILGMSITGLAIARLLGRKGIKIIGIITEVNCSTGYTRYIHKVDLSNECSNDILLKALFDIGEYYDEKPVLFVDRDKYLLFVVEYERILKNYYEIMLPDVSTVKKLNDKYELAKICDKVGIDLPRSILIKDMADYMKNADIIPFPCIIKPVLSFLQDKLKIKAMLINTREEFVFKLEHLLKRDVPLLIQEFVPGNDSHNYSLGIYLDRNAIAVAWFTARKYFQTPSLSGIGVLLNTNFNAEIIKKGTYLLESVKYVGLAEVEFKWDVRDRKMKLIEINTRPWMQIGLAEGSGINFALLAYKEQCGETIEISNHKYTEKRAWIYGLPFIMEMLKRKRVSELVSFFKNNSKVPKLSFAIFAFDDLKPFFLDIFYNAQKYLKKLRRAVS